MTCVVLRVLEAHNLQGNRTVNANWIAQGISSLKLDIFEREAYIHDGRVIQAESLKMSQKGKSQGESRKKWSCDLCEVQSG